MSKPTAAQIPTFGLDQTKFHSTPSPGPTASRSPTFGVDQALAETRPWALVFGELPSISGDPTVEETLTAVVEIPEGATAAYQWYADDEAIADADESTFELTASEEDTMVHVLVTLSSSLGVISAQSAAVGPVAAAEG